MNFKTLWLQYLGEAGDGYALAMWLGTDKDVDQDKVKEIARSKPTRKILKKLGVPEDLILAALAHV
jgi:hypothetical protein